MIRKPVKILLLAAVLPSLAVIGLLTLNLGLFRGTIEKALSEASGFTVQIEGPLNVRLGLELRVDANGIIARNDQWQGEQQVLTIGRLQMRSPLSSLFSTPVLIEDLVLIDADARLEQDESGAANWLPVNPRDEEQQARGVIVQSLQLSSSLVTWASPRLDRAVTANVQTLDQVIDDTGTMTLSARGVLNGRPAGLNLRGGPWSSLVYGGEARIEGSAQLGPAVFSGNAVFIDVRNPLRPQLSISLQAPDAREFGDMLSIDGLGDGPADLRIESRVDDERMTFDVQGILGEFVLNLEGSTGSLQTLDRSALNARISGPDFGRIARLAGHPGWPESPFNIESVLTLNRSDLALSRFSITLGDSSVSLSGDIPAFPSLEKSSLQLDLRGDDLAAFSEVLDVEGLPAGAFAVKGFVRVVSDTTMLDLGFESGVASGVLSGSLAGGESYAGSLLKLTAGGPSTGFFRESLGLTVLPESGWSVDVPVIRIGTSTHEVENARFTAPGLEIDLDGQIGAGTVRKATDVNVRLEVRDTTMLRHITGDGIRYPHPELALQGRLVAEGDGWRLHGISLNSGTETVDIEGYLSASDSWDGTRLQVSASGINPLEYLARRPENTAFDNPFELSASFVFERGLLLISGLDYRAPGASAKLDGEIPWPVDFDRGRFKADITAEDVTRLFPGIDGVSLDPSPVSAHLDGQWRSGRMTLRESRLSLGDLRVYGNGSLDLPPESSATDFSIRIETPDISSLGTFDGKRWEPASFYLESVFTGTANRFSMDRLIATLNDSTINGRFDLDYSSQKPAFDLSLHSAALNLSPLFPEDPEPQQPEAVPEEDGKDQRLIPDLVFPMALLGAADGTFEITAPLLVVNKLRLRNNILKGHVASGALAIDEMGTDGYRGRLRSQLQLVPVLDGDPEMSFSMNSEGLVLNLARQSAEEKELLPPFDIEITGTGAGPDLRSAMAQVNGSMRITSPGGQLRNLDENSISGLFISRLLSAISPSAARQEFLNISCVAAFADVNNGVVKLDPGFALQSHKLNVFVTGKINLADEALDLNLRTETRKALNISASEILSPYLSLTGTLAKPSLGINTRGTLLSGGAAYLSGGLSILARKALDKLGGTSNACGKILEGEPKPEQP